MNISFRTLFCMAISSSLFLIYVSQVRPVGWFDSVVALIISISCFIWLRYKVMK